MISEQIYLPPSPHLKAWGVALTAVGTIRSRPGELYPPKDHPKDHQFSWEKGRILTEYQMLFIANGSGSLEAEGVPKVEICTGNVFFLFPGIWHRYRPSPKTGWTEYWLELQGSLLKQLQAQRILNPKNPARALRYQADLHAAFEQVLRLTQKRASSEILGTLAYHLLARVLATSESANEPAVDDALQKAQRRMAERAETNLSMNVLAQECGIGYSHFRRAFRQRTSFSPKRYHTEIRLRKARELLAGTDLKLKEIAERLGFDSPYHLSALFKKHLGRSPKAWRTQSSRPK